MITSGSQFHTDFSLYNSTIIHQDVQQTKYNSTIIHQDMQQTTSKSSDISDDLMKRTSILSNFMDKAKILTFDGSVKGKVLELTVNLPNNQTKYKIWKNHQYGSINIQRSVDYFNNSNIKLCIGISSGSIFENGESIKEVSENWLNILNSCNEKMTMISIFTDFMNKARMHTSNGKAVGQSLDLAVCFGDNQTQIFKVWKKPGQVIHIQNNKDYPNPNKNELCYDINSNTIFENGFSINEVSEDWLKIVKACNEAITLNESKTKVPAQENLANTVIINSTSLVQQVESSIKVDRQKIIDRFCFDATGLYPTSKEIIINRIEWTKDWLLQATPEEFDQFLEKIKKLPETIIIGHYIDLNNCNRVQIENNVLKMPLSLTSGEQFNEKSWAEHLKKSFAK